MNRQALNNFKRLAGLCLAGALLSAGLVALTPPSMNPYWFIAGFWIGLAVMFIFMIYAIDWNVDSVDETKEGSNDD